MTNRVTVNLPDDLLPTLEAAGLTELTLQKEVNLQVAIGLFRRKTLSLEQAARLSGVPLSDFIRKLGEVGIAIADYDRGEIARELENAEWLKNRQ